MQTSGWDLQTSKHWKWSEREQHLAALKAGFAPRRKHILSSVFLTLRGCWLLLLIDLKLCVLPSHTGSMFFKTIHLIWTTSQRISFVLESFPEQQPHYEGVFKQMPPASASVSDNKTFSAWNIMAWLWWFIRGAWHLLLSSLHSIILQTVNKWGWLPPPEKQWHWRWKRTVIRQNLGTLPMSLHSGLLKMIGISPAGEKHKMFHCLMWLQTSALPLQSIFATPQWNSCSCGFTRVQCLSPESQGCWTGLFRFSKLKLGSEILKKKGLRNYPVPCWCIFVQDTAITSQLSKMKHWKFPLQQTWFFCVVRNFLTVTETHKFWLHWR